MEKKLKEHKNLISDLEKFINSLNNLSTKTKSVEYFYYCEKDEFIQITRNNGARWQYHLPEKELLRFSTLGSDEWTKEFKEYTREKNINILI